MSRIDEALKRASAGEPAGYDSPGAVGKVHAGSVTLEDYPGEPGSISSLTVESPPAVFERGCACSAIAPAAHSDGAAE
jgi:hypothetical protein